ncbi:bestrophin family protein [Singulisphaera sp. PoT]|uniref:bestrophin family protein n=1 Tax=Singulisphaera sp. PoT TaxID=3411797 RepID=UPI003BF5B0B3
MSAQVADISREDGSRKFWTDAFAIRGSVTGRVSRRVLTFGMIALIVTAINELSVHITLGIEVAPYEVAGAALGALLVLRTNAGYDRWWEGRKLWGAIVNQSRNLVISALAYGPEDPDWRERVVRWAAAFPHVIRHSLRGERNMPRVKAVLGDEQTAIVAGAEHMPSYVALRLAEIFREALDRPTIDRLAFLQSEMARGLLVDHYGACERILKTPLPRAYAINIRRFIFLFLASLPFALLDKIGWLTPIVTILIAYPILSLDDIGAELQNPFGPQNIGHLPLDGICANIESNLFGLLGKRPGIAEIGTTDELQGLESST